MDYILFIFNMYTFTIELKQLYILPISELLKRITLLIKSKYKCYFVCFSSLHVFCSYKFVLFYHQSFNVKRFYSETQRKFCSTLKIISNA